MNLPRDFSGAGRGDPPSRRRGRKPENKADNNDEGKDDDRGNLPVRHRDTQPADGLYDEYRALAVVRDGKPGGCPGEYGRRVADAGLHVVLGKLLPLTRFGY